MISNSQKAGMLQSFGYILTEIVMILSLLYCLDTLHYTKLFLPLIPLTLVPVLNVLALLDSGRWFSFAIVLNVVTAFVLFIYGIILIISFSSHTNEMHIADQTFGFWLLLLGVLAAITFLVWSVQYMLSLSAVPVSERLSLKGTKLTYARIRIYIVTILAYTLVLLLSTLLLYVESLAWTAFYILLFLPYGLPYLMTMILFKRDTSLNVGVLMIASVTLIDFLYAVWLLLWYDNRYVVAGLALSEHLAFWTLVAATLLRVLLASVYATLCVNDLPRSFKERFTTEIKRN